MITTLKSYADSDGNTYRVEKASNGMFVCVRINDGGNRKGYAPIGAHKRSSVAQYSLDLHAKTNGWKEIEK